MELFRHDEGRALISCWGRLARPSRQSVTREKHPTSEERSNPTLTGTGDYIVQFTAHSKTERVRVISHFSTGLFLAQRMA